MLPVEIEPLDTTGVPDTDRGPVMQTWSGHPFYLLDPHPEDVRLIDIAEGLAKINRFTGATREPYSVGQHSTLVSRLVRPELALAGLLHDAGETYTNDDSRPKKMALERLAPGILRRLNEPIDRAIWQKFGLDPAFMAAHHDEIKQADNEAFVLEHQAFMSKPIGFDLGDLPPAPSGFAIRPMHWETARDLFIRRYGEIVFGGHIEIRAVKP